MKILATDQSTNVTGIAVLIDGLIKSTERIDMSKNKNPVNRIKDMFFAIVDVIKKEDPDLLVVEAVQQQQNAKSTMMLSQLQGMLIGYAYINNIQISSPMPVEWRSLLKFKQGPSVKRKDLKLQAVKYASDVLNVFASEDECEAACIGYSEYLKEINI